MKPFLIIPLTCMIASGCAAPSTESQDEAQWIDPNMIQPGPMRRDSLTAVQLATIDSVHAIFGEADPFTREEWINNTRRDADPDHELDIWMSMAQAFKQFVEGRTRSLAEKKEAYSILLMRSMAAPEEVKKQLQLEHLTAEQADSLMGWMSIAPDPVEVVKD